MNSGTLTRHAWANWARHYLAAAVAQLPNIRGRGRLVLLLDRLLTDYADPESYMTIGELNGRGLFELDLRPWGQKFAFYYREWEKDYVHLMQRLYTGGTFVDVGSSLGLYVIGMADVVRAHQGRILSIEPVPFNLERQVRNVKLNRAESLVTYVNEAIGAQAGTVRIRADFAKADNNAYISNKGDLEIAIVRLDDLLKRWPFQRIGMIKMDIEGYEPQAIEGARETLRAHRPVILAEFNRERIAINRFSMDDIWRFLKDEIGFRCYWLDVAKARLVPLSEPGTMENILFCSQDVVDAKLGGARGAVPLADIAPVQ